MTASADTSVPVVADGRVLRLSVARGRHGTLHAEALPALTDALAALDPAEFGAVLLVSEGASFCTGMDVHAVCGAADPYAAVHALATDLHRFLVGVVECPVPVVAGVAGWAAGAGMSIVLAADLAVAGRSARIRPAYPGMGLSPDGAMTWTLPRVVGAARARHILLTDQVLDADAALALGIVSAVVEDEDAVWEAERTAYRLAQGPTAALGRTKQLLAAAGDRTLAEHLPPAAGCIADSARGMEGIEGLAAFVQRRPPRFHG